MKEYKKILFVLITALCVCALWGQGAPAQDTGEPQSEVVEYIPPEPAAGVTFMGFLGTLLKIGVSLAIIIVFIYLTVYVLKNLTSSPGQRQDLQFGNLSVIDSLYLGPGRYVYMVNVAKEILVLAASDKGLDLLSKIDDPQEVEDLLKKRNERWQQAKPFQQYLHSAQKNQQLRMYLRGSMESLKKMFGSKR